MPEWIIGHTVHKRFEPVDHSFKVPLYMLKVGVFSLSQLSEQTKYFGYNRKNWVSLFDSDYLADSTQSLPEKVRSILWPLLPDASQVQEVEMLTIPRRFRRVFNPITLYMCKDKTSRTIALFAEVSNTYHERHLYYTAPDGSQGRAFKVDKQFHVSPFFDEKGCYRFKLEETDAYLHLHIGYEVDNKVVFYANFQGKKEPFNWVTTIKLWMFWPFTSRLVLPRIMWQAFKLYFIKKLRVRSKPAQQGGLRAMPITSLQSSILKKLQQVGVHMKGRFFFELPDKRAVYIGQSDGQPDAEIYIKNNWFFRSVAFSGEIGLGESYFNHQWESPNLTYVIRKLIQNKRVLQHHFSGSLWIRALNTIKHALNRNALGKSKKNIHAHYDLGNAFYKLFLDKTMTYSSGVFTEEGESLETAQMSKVKALVDPLHLQPHDHVLEIGSGWGYVAMFLAQEKKCRVTTITLSEEQYTFVKKRVKNAGLDHLISVELKDYRHVNGVFDGIISVEMIEAVGHEFLPDYFKQLQACIKPGGRVAIQAITYPNETYDAYRKSTDFIRKHIFPGGHLPSLEILDQMRSRYTSLSVVGSRNIADSYATTLRLWREAFDSAKEIILEQGFDDTFYRKWIYYFAYCEAAFAEGYLGCYQLIYEKKEV